MTALERLLNRTGPPNENGCWPWLGAKDPSGYGALKVNGRKINTHCAALTLRGIEIPEGQEVCHTCDNRECVNPEHLFIGTRRDNMVDALNKGRIAIPIRLSECGGLSRDAMLQAIRQSRSVRAAAATLGVPESTFRDYIARYDLAGK